MNLLKKISGSFLLGLAVIGLAVGTSAFTDKVNNENKIAGEIYVNTASGQYEMLPSPSDFDDTKCLDNNQHACSWTRTSTPGEVPEDFDAETAAQLEADGLIQQNGNKNGVYQP